jgi:clan AA aspartic protease (TIGR02281 family)
MLRDRAKPFILFFLILSACFVAAKLYADTIYLKNGRSIEGVVKNEGEDFLELEFFGGTVKFRRSEIESVKRALEEDNDLIRDEWQSHKQEAEKKLIKQRREEEKKPKNVEFSSDGRGIVVPVLINNKLEVNLILDTGASFVTLKKDVAEKLGLDLDEIKSETEMILADGSRTKAKLVVLDSLSAQGVEVSKVEAVILTEELEKLDFGDGLLGMSFLKRFNFKIDQKEKKLILEKL